MAGRVVLEAGEVPVGLVAEAAEVDPEGMVAADRRLIACCAKNDGRRARIRRYVKNLSDILPYWTSNRQFVQQAEKAEKAVLEEEALTASLGETAGWEDRAVPGGVPADEEAMVGWVGPVETVVTSLLRSTAGWPQRTKSQQPLEHPPSGGRRASENYNYYLSFVG